MSTKPSKGRVIPNTPAAFRNSLKTRVKEAARREGVDIAYMQKKLVFEMFLHRVFSKNPGFYLKGGFAMDLRYKIGRSTKDLDFATLQRLTALLNNNENSAAELRNI